MTALSQYHNLQKPTFERHKARKAAKLLISDLLAIAEKAIIEGLAYHEPFDLRSMSLSLHSQISEEIKRRFHSDYDSPPFAKSISDRIIVMFDYYTGWQYEYSVLEQLAFKICASDLLSASPLSMSPPHYGGVSIANLLNQLIGGHMFQSTFLLPSDPDELSKFVDHKRSSRMWARNIVDRKRLLQPYFKNPILLCQLQAATPNKCSLKEYLREEFNAFAIMGPMTHNGLFYYDVLFENEEDEVLMRVKLPSEYPF